MLEKPDFEGRFLKAVFCQGEPDRIPMMEAGVANNIKEKFLGRPIRSLEDEVDFWYTAGYEAIPLEAGLRPIIDAAIHHDNSGRYDSSALDSPGVKAAKQFGINRMLEKHLASPNAHGGTRTWAPERDGIISSMEDLEAFPWPDPAELNYQIIRDIRTFLPPGMGTLCYAGAIFSSLMLMMGLETCFIHMLQGTELFQRLLKKIGEFQVAVVEILVELGTLGGIWINDDMGFKTRTLVNPNLYRRYTFPYYREIRHILDRKGLPLLLHSDGNITDILPDLVEIGFNAIHPIEPEAMDIYKARQIVGDKVCLIGNLSLAFPLGTGTPADVIDGTRRLIRTMAPGGSYVMSSGNSIPEYIPYENWKAMRDTALNEGLYPIRFPHMRGGEQSIG